uniref:phospho-N-acetylmuramoyl-pentapeptide- transferase n=1 Tax=Eubacterium cellulosolvens TaxID=29322 RepID=UPI0004874921|nr:phospho-N-acetylmuramoyl-pentapeptide-transferase [[Eubacterium] cellulosolvens]
MSLKLTDVIPMFLAFFVTAVSTGLLIPFLTRKKVDQTEREEGVKSHLKKKGTPTMGGLAILAGLLAVSLVYVWKNPAIAPILILIFGFGLIGFFDDFLKVVLHRSDGLIAWQKLILEFIVTGGFLFYLVKVAGVSMEMLVPFNTGASINLGWLAIPFAFIVILATVNGVNFTDGVDGLASTVTIVVALFFTIVSMKMNGEITPVTFAVAGALMAFLLFNAYPAKIFMGDTGSLALGGFVAGAAYMMKMPLYIPIVGFIYAFELLSVAMQVSYFKLTHGKRIFKMTPIHHHFELCGWSEVRIVAVFSVLTALLSFLMI